MSSGCLGASTVCALGQPRSSISLMPWNEPNVSLAGPSRTSGIAIRARTRSRHAWEHRATISAATAGSAWISAMSQTPSSRGEEPRRVWLREQVRRPFWKSSLQRLADRGVVKKQDRAGIRDKRDRGH